MRRQELKRALTLCHVHSIGNIMSVIESTVTLLIVIFLGRLYLSDSGATSCTAQLFAKLYLGLLIEINFHVDSLLFLTILWRVHQTVCAITFLEIILSEAILMLLCSQ